MNKFFVLVIAAALAWEAKAEEILLQGVPFKTQSPPGDWQHNLNCGPTSTVMLGSYYLSHEPTVESVETVLDWLYTQQMISPQANAEYYDGNVTSISQLEKILIQYYGVGATVRQNKKDLDFIRRQLLKQNPVIVGVNINMSSLQFGHFMVVVGLTDTQVVVHDPGKTLGGYKRYSLSSFLSSWATSNYATLVVRSNGGVWYPDGTLIQPVGSNKVYVVLEESLLWIKNESVFNAMSFDWQKIIPVHQRILDCMSEMGVVDWLPYREVWKINEKYYLFEKTSATAPNCAVYEFSSSTAHNSWQLKQPVKTFSAWPFYAESCDIGPTLYLHNGTLVKATNNLSGYDSGAIFVATNNGELRPFADWDTFVLMGYDSLPLLILSASEILSATKFLGQPLTSSDAFFCISGAYSIQGAADPEEVDSDGDGFSIAQGDCDDEDASINPFAEELCDNLDNNCNEEEDEGLLFDCYLACGKGVHYCDDGVWNECELVESIPEVADGLDNDCDGQVDEDLSIFDDIPPEEDIEESPTEVTCRVRCPLFMVGFAWWGNDQSGTGITVEIETTSSVLCERGEAWIDFNCACDADWSCYAWEAALVECNVSFTYGAGIIDYKGEGEVWFPDIKCF